MVEDCYAGDNGVGGCFTEGIANWRLQRRLRNTRALYDRSKVKNAYGRQHGGLMQTLQRRCRLKVVRELQATDERLELRDPAVSPSTVGNP
jgi:hypothetical protein